MAAQQKPKADAKKGTRNSGRKNGKASKQQNWRERIVTESQPNDQGLTKVSISYKERPRFGPNGVKLSGKGKRSFKSCLGINVERLIRRAKNNGTTFRAEVHHLYRARAERELFRARVSGKSILTTEQVNKVWADKADAWIKDYYQSGRHGF